MNKVPVLFLKTINGKFLEIITYLNSGIKENMEESFNKLLSSSNKSNNLPILENNSNSTVLAPIILNSGKNRIIFPIKLSDISIKEISPKILDYLIYLNEKIRAIKSTLQTNGSNGSEYINAELEKLSSLIITNFIQVETLFNLNK